MKKLRLLTAVLLVTMLAVPSMPQAQVRKIAILEAVDKDGSVSYAIKLMLRSNLAKAIANTPGYEAYDRTDIDAIMGEQNFQRTGMVSDAQIKKLGEMTGAAYILVAEAAKVDEKNVFITAKILNVETAKTEMTDNVLMSATPSDIQNGCESLAKKLLGVASVPRNNGQQNTGEKKGGFFGSIANAFSKKDKEPAEPKQNQTPAPQQPLFQLPADIGKLMTFPDGTKGIIFYKEGDHGLAISMDRGEYPWETAKRPRDCGDIAAIPNNEDDDKNFQAGLGATYTTAILQQLGTASAQAAAWCVNHGNGWYLPSAGELAYLFKVANSAQAVNNGLLQNGGYPLSDSWYWSSSEVNNQEALNVSSRGGASTENKINPVTVRAVRSF